MKFFTSPSVFNSQSLIPANCLSALSSIRDKSLFYKRDSPKFLRFVVVGSERLYFVHNVPKISTFIPYIIIRVLYSKGPKADTLI